MDPTLAARVVAWLTRQVDRARVVLTSAVTIITLITFGLTAVVIPAASEAYGADSTWVQYLVQAAAVLTGIVEIIRRVTPVAKAQRGVLPRTVIDTTSREAPSSA